MRSLSYVKPSVKCDFSAIIFLFIFSPFIGGTKMVAQTKPKTKPKLELVGKIEYSEECYLLEECSDSAESYFGIEDYLDDNKLLKFTEEEIKYYDPEKGEYGYIPASDCDGVSTCWRNYVGELGGKAKAMLVLQFREENIKVMNEVVGIRFGLTIYLLKKSSPSP